MAKDAKGHGSDARGSSAGGPSDTTKAMFKGGGSIAALEEQANKLDSANADRGELGAAHSANSGEAHVASIAAQHGVSTVHLTGKANPDHIWPGQMRSGQKVSNAEHQYNRDLALRSRNGQVGSGMKFRG